MATIEPGQQFQFDQPTEKALVDAAQVREMFNALARNNYTTSPAYPNAPRVGMARVNAADPNNVKFEIWYGDPGAWRTVLQNIHIGVPAPVKQIIQVTAAATAWTVDHNLGSRVIAMAFDTSFRQFRVAHTFERVPLFLGRVDLALASGPIRLGVPTPFDGQIRRSWGFVPHPGILGPVVGSLDLDIGGTPVGGGQILLPGPIPPAIRIDGTPIATANAFVKGNDDINLLAPIPTGGVPGDALEVWIELEKTLQADEYFLDQPTENRIVVTHSSPRQGWIVLIG